MSIVDPDLVENAPFEGPEKLLEIWFSPEPINGDAEGLRKVPRETWEEMLDIVKCKVLSVIRGNEVDAYLLRFEIASCEIEILLKHLRTANHHSSSSHTN
jgi:hypothetical protein